MKVLTFEISALDNNPRTTMYLDGNNNIQIRQWPSNTLFNIMECDLLSDFVRVCTYPFLSKSALTFGVTKNSFNSPFSVIKYSESFLLMTLFLRVANSTRYLVDKLHALTSQKCAVRSIFR